jgi:hypothetical protein
MTHPAASLPSAHAGRVPEIRDRLLAVFLQEVPLHAAPAKGRKPLSRQQIEARLEAGLGRFYEAARHERLTHRLGVISQARVAFGLQQGLVEAGYPPPQVKQVLFAMLASAFVGAKR